MEMFLGKVLPMCLSSMGGAILVMSIFTLMGKADILMEFEYRHFAKKFLKKLARTESAFGIILGCLLFFCASAILFENMERIWLAIIMLGVMVVIYLILYIIFGLRMREDKSVVV